VLSEVLPFSSIGVIWMTTNTQHYRHFEFSEGYVRFCGGQEIESTILLLFLQVVVKNGDKVLNVKLQSRLSPDAFDFFTKVDNDFFNRVVSVCTNCFNSQQFHFTLKVYLWVSFDSPKKRLFS
jgi:hypothetical protein